MKHPLDIIERFKNAGSANELFLELHKALAQYSISRVYYGIADLLTPLDVKGTLTSPSYHISSYSKSFLQRYEIQNDYTTLHCFNKTTPLLWHEYKHWPGITQEQYNMVRADCDFNMGIGLTLPLRFNYVGMGGIGIAAENITAKDFAKQWQHHHQDIITILNIFDQFMRTSHKREWLPVLTPREKEILTLRVHGLKPAALENKLKVSQSTLETHAANMKRKLTATNFEQVVVKAISLELIDL